ncbi:uncharacterized protein METZ01_LOCUS288452 [marine metagenome]|uniref:Uncharacterized protein n=1 Tax=marine metagenome TaxID=408172 RepID=A0A382LFP6_9ZZZZ
MVDNIARKVAEEPINESLKEIKELLENVDEGNYEYMPKRPQHVIDEEKVDEAILERHDRRQMEMFDDPYMNWSGLR